MYFFNALNTNNWLHEKQLLDVKSNVYIHDRFYRNGSKHLLFYAMSIDTVQITLCPSYTWTENEFILGRMRILSRHYYSESTHSKGGWLKLNYLQ